MSRPTHPDEPSEADLHDMRTVVVRFRVPSDMAQLNARDLSLRRYDEVVVETDHGPEVATVLMAPEPNRVQSELPKVLRLVTDEDIAQRAKNRLREREAFQFCRERIAALGQPMKLVDVELSHSGTRATFYFTSDDRVDFRALVKDLARRFHTRIEMRQIGVRDAARHTGGIGTCGRQLCCSTWLPSFQPVSIRMAKEQNLTLNHDKLSGLCGRLRCCLRYEQETYQRARRGMPKIGRRVVTPDGLGRVRDLNVLERRVSVTFPDGRQKEYDADEVARPPEPEQMQRPPVGFSGDDEAGPSGAALQGELPGKPKDPGPPSETPREPTSLDTPPAVERRPSEPPAAETSERASPHAAPGNPAAGSAAPSPPGSPKPPLSSRKRGRKKGRGKHRR